jgi:hypothetical protein
MLPPFGEKRRLRTIRISGLIHAASTPALLRFALRVATHTQGWLPAGWLAFTGRASNPLDHIERFQIMVIPLSCPPDAIPSTAPRLAYQTGPSLVALRLSFLPACPLRDQVCLHPSCSPRQHGPSALSRSHLLGGAPPFKRHSSLYPRGPRSGSGYVVPYHRHLSGPMRPTRRHTAISPHSGLYAMPSLCGSA